MDDLLSLSKMARRLLGVTPGINDAVPVPHNSLIVAKIALELLRADLQSGRVAELQNTMGFFWGADLHVPRAPKNLIACFRSRMLLSASQSALTIF